MTVSFFTTRRLPDLSFTTAEDAARGDTWLKNHLGAYATWAKANNSLFIVTFDEDDSSASNHIPTLFYGAHVATGSYSEHITHYTTHPGDPWRPVSCTGNSCSASATTDIWN